MKILDTALPDQVQPQVQEFSARVLVAGEGVVQFVEDQHPKPEPTAHADTRSTGR
ncbi:hypothetical protein R3P96_25015 [Rhodococcus yunnanensis]|uniref:Uncharacterized protein n=1 Tax=Rhodococcoides yunnanense TaxID=278209 RepID=A0ABU4BKL3_9NOCA|nr:hypothetical protein [Rhodococcus yunnanensis]MDV6264611.1 hypothetical protein [Rhodococcus yunnanensis]